MKIVLASQSGKKIAAIRAAFGEEAELITINAPSDINEQPIGDETFQGAKNRIAFAQAACPGADLYVSIENGLFEENGEYVDRAIVTISNGRETSTTRSDGVTFPKEYVMQTRDRAGGFAKWTVGKTMAQAGIVKDDADPHLDLSGKPRSEYLNEATRKAAAKLNL